jgi:hypothetical protein
MKATAVGSEVPDIPSQPCVECGKKLNAPWGRVSGGKWVCSSQCEMAWDTKQHTLPVMDILNRVAMPLPDIAS